MIKSDKSGFKTELKKGDQVVVITGQSKGRRGKILRVLPKKSAVIVENVNMVKRHTRPSKEQAGGIIEREAPIHISNVMIVDPTTGKPTRIKQRVLGNGERVRVSCRSNEQIDN